MTKEIGLVEQEKLRIDKSLETSATYSFNNEDHTLGNVLRSLLMKEYFFFTIKIFKKIVQVLPFQHIQCRILLKK